MTASITEFVKNTWEALATGLVGLVLWLMKGWYTRRLAAVEKLRLDAERDKAAALERASLRSEYESEVARKLEDLLRAGESLGGDVAANRAKIDRIMDSVGALDSRLSWIEGRLGKEQP